jgi:hypothetical protein
VRELTDTEYLELQLFPLLWEDPLQKRRVDRAQCLARKGGFSFMGRGGQEGAGSAQEKFQQPIIS